jgi:hypothetical protein
MPKRHGKILGSGRGVDAHHLGYRVPLANPGVSTTAADAACFIHDREIVNALPGAHRTNWYKRDDARLILRIRIGAR